ncbi:MAG: hypothetical protein A3G32_00540 [Deltaproteobacteria bacterium RIFCSPLOWO2_12_FULL_40_28]|nr:MAG: hypothetical protein A3C45_04550 [Deltaproteobacteria bacterium RIFCSPHIGHO2_02_FULL_40_28]OGQ21154.1 MAG: hypothetical protein A3E27_05310 [Deltaproteobacteria bacterium RIFCSPHIGHO2_12_FULL_40_32]OGQ39139.1 MAG: hypothetical protein A3I69_05845 [Deltaproteobacteria bacterium RIFCSPLOWO2_02_FULL_40_36]OGQ53209.1 MAG: hypothetical protein A3G32_00540 [Deltaproteobacteria bacterium RIFCSPLOWO2_12_FULL_40_28]
MNTNWTGFLTLIDREFYRFMRLSRQTIFPPLITTVLFILIFGYSLGTKIHEIHGFSYILYIFPGLLQMGVINNAYANSSTSLFMSRFERSIENMLVAPLTPFQLVTSYMMGALLRGLVVAIAIYVASLPFVSIPVAHPFLILASLVFSSLFFGGLGIVCGLWSESWDKIALYTNFVLTPLTYLGGVFYSLEMLPPFWHKVSLINPIFYSVDLIRYGFLGHSDASPVFSLSLLFLLAIGVYLWCFILFRRGYKLIK